LVAVERMRLLARALADYETANEIAHGRTFLFWCMNDKEDEAVRCWMATLSSQEGRMAVKAVLGLARFSPFPSALCSLGPGPYTNTINIRS